VVNELTKRNYLVTVADLTESLYFDNKIFRYCDILDKENIEDVLDEPFEYIYNFAGFANLDKSYFHPVETINLNVIGNLNILECCKEKQFERFIFASSAYAMSDKGSYYGISKLASEKLIEEYYKDYGLKFTIVRYGSVYSERDFENNYIFNLIREAIRTKSINHDGDGEEIREYIHAADAAKLSVDIIESEDYENDHIILTGFERMKRKELFNTIKEIIREDITITLKNKGYKSHYSLTPYTFHPTVSRKLIANPFIDLGQGILECIKEVHRLENNT
jgi:UDP-glucose 4-epimerase